MEFSSRTDEARDKQSLDNTKGLVVCLKCGGNVVESLNQDLGRWLWRRVLLHKLIPTLIYSVERGREHSHTALKQCREHSLS